MSKTTRDVMTRGRPAEQSPSGTIGAETAIDEALQAMLERNAETLAVIDGHEIIGRVTQGELAISIEDTRTWSALCK